MSKCLSTVILTSKNPAKKRHQGRIPGDLASISALHHSQKMQWLTESRQFSAQFKRCVHIQFKKKSPLFELWEETVDLTLTFYMFLMC